MRYLSFFRFILFFALGSVLNLSAQTAQEYYGQVASVDIRQENSSVGGRLRFIVLPMYSERSVNISFDLLGDEEPHLIYRLRHTDPNGNTSELSDIEVIGGVNEYEIRCEGLVAQEGIPYVRYSFDLSAKAVHFKVSGRYRLEVVSRDFPDEVFYSLPVFVTEERALLSLTAKSNILGLDLDREQGVEAHLNLQALNTLPQAGELFLKIYQNYSLSLPHQSLERASHETGYQWSYLQSAAARFMAGNSYNYIEHRGRNGEGEGYEESRRSAGLLSLLLSPTDPSQEKTYRHRQDRQGLALYPEGRGYYHLVRFALRAPRLERGRYIIEGQAFDHLSLEERTLRYDDQADIYVLTLPLKEGYQEYKYLRLGADDTTSQHLDSSHREKPNAYTGFVYYKPLGSRYTRLLSTGNLSPSE